MTAVATEYTVNLDEPDVFDRIRVQLTCLAGEGPHKPPYDTWAVRKRGWCLNADYEWVLEPIPSDRDDAFLRRTRWNRDEALRRARIIVRREAMAA